jgi:gluconate 5-dehydrogenase
VKRTIDATGRIDVLVNNGHDPISADWSEVSAEQFSRQLANATSYFLLARHVRNHAVELGHSASIVMIGSMYGVVGSYPDAYAGIVSASPAAYHALKGGIIHLTRHLAVYWAKDNVRVNCMSPGPFPAPMINERLVERLKSKSPFGRMGQPHELKGPLLLLASDAGTYITGQNLIVDGGWTAW